MISVHQFISQFYYDITPSTFHLRTDLFIDVGTYHAFAEPKCLQSNNIYK